MVSIQDGIVIKEKRARHVVPAEMEKFTVEIQDLISTNELSIEMEILAWKRNLPVLFVRLAVS